jgi:ribosomal protein S18 acetylase RimI-like enzyme
MVNLDLKIEGPLLNRSSICVPLLRMLPDWFGIEEAILDYERQIEHLPTFLAKEDGRVLGFLSLKQHNPFAAEILVMAVHPQAQRGGIGRALVEAAEAHARGLGLEYMQVKTLGPSHPDEGYARTRLFYEALGFRPLEEFKQIWDENNPCLVLVKRL